MGKQKISAKDVMQAHSKAKVVFYQKYLERYLSVMAVTPYFDTINIFDVFCGRGEYDNDEVGSPILAVEAIKNVCGLHPTKKKICLYLNDINPKNVEKVKQYIDEHHSDYRDFCTIQYWTEEADKVMDSLGQTLSSTPSNVRNLIFLDPYGYKEIHKDMLEKLLSNGKTEILLFLPISFLYRFRTYAFEEETNASVKPLRNFIEEFFPAEHPARNDESIEIKQYIEYLTKAFSFDNKYYTTQYYIQRNESTYFALFFFLTNILGLQKAVETRWELDKKDGKGFNYSKDKKDGQMLLFEEEFAKDKQDENYKHLLSLIMEQLKISQMNNGEMYEFVLRQGFLPTHANMVLKDLQDNNQIDVTFIKERKPAKKHAFYINHGGYNRPTITIKLKTHENDQNRMD